MEGKDAVNIVGREWPVKLPPQFTVAEELVRSYGESVDDNGQFLRACGAILGIATKIGNEAGADYVKAGFRPLAYGGAVYGWLREKGATPKEIAELAAPLYARMRDRCFPRESEVSAQAGFTEPAPAE